MAANRRAPGRKTARASDRGDDRFTVGIEPYANYADGFSAALAKEKKAKLVDCAR